MFLVRKLDNFLNGITMYRLILYSLALLATVAIIFGFGDVLSFSGVNMIASVAILLGVCYSVNVLLSSLYKAPRNTESALITGLILFCILTPPTTLPRATTIALAGILAIASKYVLAINHKHIFNPAAIAAVVIAILALSPASWWIGSKTMLPFVIVVGLLVVRKIRRFHMLFSFLAVALLVMIYVGLRDGRSLSALLSDAFYSYPLIFFGTIMLTEPMTTPPTRTMRLIYGAIAGTLFSLQFHVWRVYSSPEVALVLANIYAFAVSIKFRLTLKLKEKRELAPNLYDFIFTPSRKLEFKAGQYLEWTLPHKGVDGRGNRRSFSIASSPTEKEIHLGVKFYEPSSSFKRALHAMKPGQKVIAGQLTGDFVLPHDAKQKLVFIAGGIGITPFRGMLKYLADMDEKRNIVLFYCVADATELVYKDVLDEAVKRGVKIVPVLTAKKAPRSWRGHTGYLDAAMIKQEVRDFNNRMFYLSGPNAMVTSYKHMLHKMGVAPAQIVTDYFSGY